MSIRFKILAGCLCLTLLTVILGVIAHRSERALGEVATSIYDKGLMSLSYLRASQNGLITLRAKVDRNGADDPMASGGVRRRALLEASLSSIRDDLEVARARAMSPAGGEATARLAGHIEDLLHLADRDTLSLIAGLDLLQQDYDTAVEIYAGDGFRFRRSVGQIAEQALRDAWIAILMSVAVAVFITWALTRSVVPPIRQAVAIAQSIATGKLDNRIKIRGRDECAQLLGALAIMQGSLAKQLKHITELMADETARHEVQIDDQNARFEAALNNMSQGLCMFDEHKRLAIFNTRFVNMFGKPSLGTAADAVLGCNPDSIASKMEKFTVREMSDGRVISISTEAMAKGGWVSTYEDVTERRRAEERLSYLARHDPLTGLPNRTAFREYMDQLRDQRGSPAVLCLDIDRFKIVNDTLGHPVGDALLCSVADRLQAISDGSDLLVRLGGDEFALVRTAYQGPEEIAMLAAVIVEMMAAPFAIETHQIVVGISVGAALADPEVLDPDRVLKHADIALYRAKADGRGTFRFFEPEMDARLQARRSLELDLRGAMAGDQFELHYQPLVNTGTGQVAGFEALLRWRHPERGLVPPGSFISIAEESGLIEEIGEWVIETACREALNWPDHVRVAVNLSPVQFRNRMLAARVAGALARTGLSPRRLELEVTESVLLNDTDAVLAILRELKMLGLGIAMDDFGTGYSSLSYLRKFPFDKIKIDQSFVRELSEHDGLAIVRAILALGQSLKLDVIAEGVETAEQLGALQDEGCLHAQGYFLGRPTTAAGALEALMLPPQGTHRISHIGNAA